MPNGQPPNPESSQETPPPETEKPISERFQNHFNLRRRLQSDFTNSLPQYMDRGFPPNFQREQATKASVILAQRSIKHLPKGEITQESLSNALLTAQDELAYTEDWFDMVLPKRKQRQRLAQALTQVFNIKEEQPFLQAAVAEQETYAEQSLQQISDQELLVNDLKSQLQEAGFPPEQSQKIASQTLLDIEHQALRYGASPPAAHFESFLRQSLAKEAGRARQDEYPELAKNIREKSQVSLNARTEAIAHNRQKIAKDPSLAKKLFGYLRKDERLRTRFPKIDKTLKIAGAITRPIYTVKKAIGRRIAIGVGKLASKLLIKIGLGTVVRYAEEIALSVGTAGLGLPIAILQEIAARGFGNLIKTAKRIRNDWQTTIRTGLRNPLEGSIRLIGSTVDTAAAAVGGGIGATVGAVAGMLIGATLGSVIPVVGTIAGGILGGVVGGIAGGGFGAKKGYELRRKIQKKLMTSLALRLFLKALLAQIKLALANIAFGAVLGTFLIPIPIVGTVVGGWLGGKFKLFERAVDLLAKAKDFFTTGGVQATVSKAAIATKQIFATAGKLIATGEGLFAQTLRGIGSILGKIPSGIAQAFNTVTGWFAGTTTGAVATTEAVATEVLTAGPGKALTLTPIASIATVGLFAVITYTALVSVFHVPPTEVEPYFEDPSRFIRIRKLACIDGRCGITTLANPETTGYEITYQIEISPQATDQILNIISVEDEYSTYGENNSPTPSTVRWTEVPPLAPGESWSPPTPPQVTISAGDTRWFNSLLTDTVTVSFTVGADPAQIQASESLTLTIGEPPFCAPSLSPFADAQYYISGYRWDPARHPAVDLASRESMPWDVHSTHACAAQVVYVQNSPTFNCFGIYVVLQSGPYYTFAVHLTRTSVTQGQIVGPGHIIGKINGTTGCSTGPHDHYEIRMGPGVSPESDWQPWSALNPCNYGINCR